MHLIRALGWAFIVFIVTLCLNVPFHDEARASISNPPVGPQVRPNVGLTCGQDSTTVIQTAINNAATATFGFVWLPACSQASPIIISATITIPDNTLVCGQGMGITWVQKTDTTNNYSVFANTNYQGPTTTITTTSGSATATVGNAEAIGAGSSTPNAAVITSANVPANTQVRTIAGTTITMSANATVTGTAAASFTLANATQANTGITLCGMSISGNHINGASSPTAKKAVWFNGVAQLSMVNIECTAAGYRCLMLDGNGADVNPCYVRDIYVHDTNDMGLSIDHAQRRCTVSAIKAVNTKGNGIYLDASEMVISDFLTLGAGNGGTVLGLSTCANSGSNVVDNPADGTSAQINWSPCPAGIRIYNVTNVTGGNFRASENYYYGVLIHGCKFCSFTGIVATSNSQASLGTWDDIHLAVNIGNPNYGETSNFSMVGVVVGANSQDGYEGNSPSGALHLSTPTARYGFAMEDGITGSAADAKLHTAGTGYSTSDSLTCVGGTVTNNLKCKFKAFAQSGGVITTLTRDNAISSGQYTVLPSNPVSLTGGTGANASADITWSNGFVTGLVIGQTVTGGVRAPTYMGGWCIRSDQGVSGSGC